MAGTGDNLRLFGQDTELRFLRDTGIEESLTDVISFSTTDKLVLKEHGYLGETTNRHTTIFNGTTGSASFHIERAAAFKLQQDLILRARRDPSVGYFTVTGMASFSCPDGGEYRVSFPDLQIHNIKIDDSKREELIVMSFDWACDAPLPMN